MPIVECKDCKTMVSTSAEVCPKCGAKYPASYVPSKVIVHRSPNILGFAVKFVIYADEQKMGGLWRDETLDFMLSYGDHIIKVNSQKFSIRILPAKIYRIELIPAFGGVNFESYVTDA